MGSKATNTEEINPTLRKLVRGSVTQRSQAIEDNQEPPQQGREEQRDQKIEERTARPSQPARNARGTGPNALKVNRKVMFTEVEATRNEEITALVSSCFGGPVTYSQISRALWSALAGAEKAIREGAKRQPRRTFPSTGNVVAMAEYEDAVAEFLATALRRS